MRASILLVDDRPANLFALKELLAEIDADVSTTTSGRDALDQIGRDPPDLVIADLCMPIMDGTDLLRHVRRLPGPHIPVLVATAYADRKARVRALEAGADDFLEKPIDPPILLARVRTLLSLRAAARLAEDRNTALENLQREQRELMGFIVHDLKNPLGAARLNVEWVADQTDRQDFKEALADASEGLERAARMVQDLLVVARLESGAAPLRRDRVVVSPLLDRIVRAQTKLADQRGIKMSVSVEDASLAVPADSGLLARVFENLIDNALRHTPASGRVAIAARKREMIEIDVANTGTPISRDERNVIFARFGRGRDEIESVGNVGLGLYFCKHAVAAHGGRIGLADRAGWPTTFRVQLPAA